MIDLKNTPRERAILIALPVGGFTKEQVEEHLDELELLASTAGAETVFKILQDRIKPDPAYFIGKGKAEEIAQLIELNDIQIVIFDNDLNPTQVRNLEKLFNRKILDRSGLILDIFALHAKTREAKTQVELAQLEYMLPRLTRAWTHLSKQYGGIGTKGPGETQIETDRRLIRTRISKLKENLRKIESQQIVKSSARKKLINATLVGYTNAGKSTLLNLLTNASVLAEDKLFATLDSTTRIFNLEKNKQILLSDTVGFIRKLPAHLVASFKSTLNVVSDADVILHVIDASHDYFEDHIKTVDDTLRQLHCDKKLQIKIFNKIDALKEKDIINYISANYPGSYLVSAQRGIGIQKLKSALIDIYEQNFVEGELRISHTQPKKISMVYEIAEVLDTRYEDEFVLLKYRTSKINENHIKKLIQHN
ncbi:GTP-binding protein HflX [Melioribacter roseus P3M-2]|uniref:GTPase HflX n=1 Tax=Melioribacter roseus (strain DSM 23840 / JCM 17771 / VKM B-2668 / P3M-2) TaxID=1191523 RepID=I6ZY69_MELRP|nr:GTPase HflX [Melioribacter roseus]AFN73958.1 GTP-binding protein HflX [Melioribacter roseus P3M-2]